jgi:hypothetical protein
MWHCRSRAPCTSRRSLATIPDRVVTLRLRVGDPTTNLEITARGGYFYPATSGYFYLAIHTDRSLSHTWYLLLDTAASA